MATVFRCWFLTCATQPFFGAVFLFVAAPKVAQRGGGEPFIVALCAKNPEDVDSKGPENAPSLPALLEDTAMARSILTMTAPAGASMPPPSADAAQAVHQLAPALHALVGGHLAAHATEERAAMGVLRALPALYAASVAAVPHVVLDGVADGDDDGDDSTSRGLRVRVVGAAVPAAVVPDHPLSPPKVKFEYTGTLASTPSLHVPPNRPPSIVDPTEHSVCVGDDRVVSSKDHDEAGPDEERRRQPSPRVHVASEKGQGDQVKARTGVTRTVSPTAHRRAPTRRESPGPAKERRKTPKPQTPPPSARTRAVSPPSPAAKSQAPAVRPNRTVLLRQQQLNARAASPPATTRIVRRPSATTPRRHAPNVVAAPDRTTSPSRVAHTVTRIASRPVAWPTPSASNRIPATPTDYTPVLPPAPATTAGWDAGYL